MSLEMRLWRSFANPNIACKRSDPATLEFLEREFGVARRPGKSRA